MTTVYGAYQSYTDRGCDHRNEIGIWPSGKTIEFCKNQCDGYDTCVSFEHRNSTGTCQLSTSCTYGYSTSFPGWTLHVKTAGSIGDPHLTLAHGGKADFRGKDQTLYNYLSAANVSLNVKVEESVFKLNDVTVDGTFLTEAHFVHRYGPNVVRSTLWAKRTNDANWAWNMVTGMCNDVDFVLGPSGSYNCNGFEVKTGQASVIWHTPEWEIVAKPRNVFNHISGTDKRVDVFITALIPHKSMITDPHGIIGQSYGKDQTVNGKRDVYPAKGHFKTSALAEGAIEGDVDMYVAKGPYDTQSFKFSKFYETA